MLERRPVTPEAAGSSPVHPASPSLRSVLSGVDGTRGQPATGLACRQDVRVPLDSQSSLRSVFVGWTVSVRPSKPSVSMSQSESLLQDSSRGRASPVHPATYDQQNQSVPVTGFSVSTISPRAVRRCLRSRPASAAPAAQSPSRARLDSGACSAGSSADPGGPPVLESPAPALRTSPSANKTCDVADAPR